jgi:ribosomal protein S18 acetylase RimI-like enzyme
VAAAAGLLLVEPLAPEDIVGVAQCIAIDADAFPYPSTQFGVRSGSARACVARDAGGGRVLGFAAGRVRGGVLRLEGLAVDFGARRRGVGRALLREALARARAEGVRAVGLHVSVGNRAAIGLYESEGFVVERCLHGFYPAAAFDGEADAYEMALVVAGRD